MKLALIRIDWRWGRAATAEWITFLEAAVIHGLTPLLAGDDQ
jgi:hypothetical protein